jgi:hypothetical protein
MNAHTFGLCPCNTTTWHGHAWTWKWTSWHGHALGNRHGSSKVGFPSKVWGTDTVALCRRRVVNAAPRLAGPLHGGGWPMAAARSFVFALWHPRSLYRIFPMLSLCDVARTFCRDGTAGVLLIHSEIPQRRFPIDGVIGIYSLFDFCRAVCVATMCVARTAEHDRTYATAVLRSLLSCECDDSLHRLRPCTLQVSQPTATHSAHVGHRT